jgi:hypothetical protein
MGLRILAKFDDNLRNSPYPFERMGFPNNMKKYFLTMKMKNHME